MWEEEEALLEASRKAYQDSAGATSSNEEFTDGTELIMLDDESGSATSGSASAIKHRNAASVSSTSKHPHNAKSKKHSIQRLLLPDTHEDSLASLEVTGTIPPERKPSKRQMDEYRSKSAGSQWYDMPAFPGSSKKNADKDARVEGGKSSFTGGDARAMTEKEMRRQVTAIRLRNALDPKRFYRGNSGTGAERAMPAYAQLGKIIGGGLEPTSVLTRKQRSDSVVGELMRDAGSVSYSKRKFDEVCILSTCSHASHSFRKGAWPTHATPTANHHVAASTAVPRVASIST